MKERGTLAEMLGQWPDGTKGYDKTTEPEPVTNRHGTHVKFTWPSEDRVGDEQQWTLSLLNLGY